MKKIVAVIFTLFAITLIACGVNSKSSDDDVKRLNDRAAASTVPNKPVEKGITAGDWEVGKTDNLDAGVITSGTYIIIALESGVNCYYKAVRSFDDDLNSIIVNGNIDPGKTKLLVIKPSYAGLSLEGDCLAKKKK